MRDENNSKYNLVVNKFICFLIIFFVPRLIYFYSVLIKFILNFIVLTVNFSEY